MNLDLDLVSGMQHTLLPQMPARPCQALAHSRQCLGDCVIHCMQDSQLRKNSALFDLDKQWSSEPNFVVYDFNNPEDIPANIHHTFDCIVIDPPFITHEVWRQYAAAAKLLLAPEGE